MFLRKGGGFVMSDDSHGIDHIGTNYARLLAFIKTAGIERIHYAERAGQGREGRFSSIALADLVQLPFWGRVD
jgi:histidinol-phosphatase (PHP family)